MKIMTATILTAEKYTVSHINNIMLIRDPVTHVPQWFFLTSNQIIKDFMTSYAEQVMTVFH